MYLDLISRYPRVAFALHGTDGNDCFQGLERSIPGVNRTHAQRVVVRVRLRVTSASYGAGILICVNLGSVGKSRSQYVLFIVYSRSLG